MVEERLSEIIGTEPQKALQATLPNHRITFWRVSSFPNRYAKLAATGGFPVLIPAKEEEVHGVAYLISEEQLSVLDKNEGEFGYKRAQFQVNSAGTGSIPAFAHNRSGGGEFFPPSSGFLELMLRGLTEHGYSEDVIEKTKESARMGDK